jgi:hypothetical protein
MMNRLRSSGIIFLLLFFSCVVYFIQFLIFHRPEETAFYFFEDLGFVPISVLLVTLGLNTVLVRREKLALLEKVGIVVNEFFAEAGTEILLALLPFLSDRENIAVRLQPRTEWTDKDFFAAKAYIQKSEIRIRLEGNDLTALAEVLARNTPHILRLFENSGLLEHDSFTDMLWAIYHIHDELRSRESLDMLRDSDLRHLQTDIQRGCRLLLLEWIDAMKNMRVRYPYLYSLAVRKSPIGEGKIEV